MFNLDEAVGLQFAREKLCRARKSLMREKRLAPQSHHQLLRPDYIRGTVVHALMLCTDKPNNTFIEGSPIS